MILNEFGQFFTEFFGFMFFLGALKITVNSSKEALKDECDLQSFLGLSNRYWQSITEISGLIMPSVSTKKGNLFHLRQWIPSLS